jgi:hypothetical protein
MIAMPNASALVSKTVSKVCEADAYTESLDPTGITGSYYVLAVGYGIDAREYNSYLRFNFVGRPSNWNKAEIILNFSTVTASISLDVYTIEEPWLESTICWNNAPGQVTFIKTIDISSIGLYTLNVTDFILEGMTNISIVIMPNSESGSTNIYIDSKEKPNFANAPIIVWTYEGEKDIPGYSTVFILALIVGISVILLRIVKKQVSFKYK